MLVTIDGSVLPVQPDYIDWTPPEVLGHGGDGAPLRGRYWKCTLAFGDITTAGYETLVSACDSLPHTFTLPHPRTGRETTVTGYVESVAMHLDTSDPNVVAVRGVDVELSHIAL